jgi:hypothetical protein
VHGGYGSKAAEVPALAAILLSSSLRASGDCQGAMLKRMIDYVLPALALFACVWVTRVFVGADVVALVMPLASSLLAIALVGIVDGLLPALPLGVAYGLMRGRPAVSAALVIALSAAGLELVFASFLVPWWAFVSWFVLPLECLTLVVFFPAAAWVGSHLLSSRPSAVRRRVGLILFAVLALCAIACSWLYSCVHLGACGLVA